MPEPDQQSLSRSEGSNLISVPDLPAILNPAAGGPPAVASFDVNDPANLQRIVEADLPAEVQRTDIEGQAFPVHHWMAAYSPNISTDQEKVQPGIRLTFWTKEGNTLSLSGTVAVKCWAKVIGFKGWGPYDPPLLIVARPFRTRENRESYGIIPLTEGGNQVKEVQSTQRPNSDPAPKAADNPG